MDQKACSTMMSTAGGSNPEPSNGEAETPDSEINDPFEFTSNFTPTLKRVRSRTKLPASSTEDQTQTDAISIYMRRQLSTSSFARPTAKANAKYKQPCFVKEEECLNPALTSGNEEEGKSLCDKSRNMLDSQNPRPLSEVKTSCPPSLPPKKPRLAHMLKSSSDIRPARKPVMIEPDFQMPSASPIVHRSSRLFSRSTVNLRLAPAPDEGRKTPEQMQITTVRSSPRKKFCRSSTVSDLTEMSATPTRRRLISAGTESKRPLTKIRQRSSSVDLKVTKKTEQSRELSNTRVLTRRSSLTKLDGCSEAIVNNFSVDNNSECALTKLPGVDNGSSGDEVLPCELNSSVVKAVEPCEEGPALPAATILPSKEEVKFSIETACDDDLRRETHLSPERTEVMRDKETEAHCVDTTVDVCFEQRERCSEAACKQEICEIAATSTTIVAPSSCIIPNRDVDPGKDGRVVSQSTPCKYSDKAGSSTHSFHIEADAPVAAADSDPPFSEVETAVAVPDSIQLTKRNKSVRFLNVSVFYFARTQGTSTVPKSGEVALGMMDKHFKKRQFPLWLGRRPELTLINDSEDSVSEGEDVGDIFDPEGHERCTAYQLPTLEGKTRIKMLKRSGVQVQKEETPESLESIRRSRLLCGCQCEGGVCVPETCQCALEGINCQVDGIDDFGSSHPCSCSSADCGNPEGRIEFDVAHVRNHCRMTILRVKHAEQMGVYDSPQRIRFTSEGEAQTAVPICGPSTKNVADVVDERPLRKFPVTPVYKRTKQKRGIRLQLMDSTQARPHQKEIKAELADCLDHL
ncbi:unnamed protein product [Nippostrongylus brasiliensis]|uniref:Axud1 (inferred by orthology to a D. melanogaster protein) n=1 Tax=Nippostrongylus brasiliensis TaxID=27835 RepID=A0A0N4YBT7_NIPBR|nr:unnamed protein product [Nippostrongylus brasiliensis]